MISKSEFVRYEKVRQSGTTNMFDLHKVCELSGLDKKDVLMIIKSYDTLSQKYKEV